MPGRHHRVSSFHPSQDGSWIARVSRITLFVSKSRPQSPRSNSRDAFSLFFLSFLERYDVLRGSRLVKLHEPASPFMPLAKLLILPPCILFEALVGPVARPAIVKIRGLYRDKRPTAPTVIHLFANSYNRCKFKFLFLPSFLSFFPVPGNLGDNGALEGGRSNGSAKEIILQRGGGGGGGDCIYEFIFHDARRGQARRPKMGVSRTIRHPASSSTLPLPRSTHVSFLVPQIILPGVVPFSFSPGVGGRRLLFAPRIEPRTIK